MMLLIFLLTLLSANLWPALPSEAAIILCAALACICFFWARSRGASLFFVAIVIMALHGNHYQHAVERASTLDEYTELLIQSVQVNANRASFKVMARLDTGEAYAIRLNWPESIGEPRIGELWLAKLRLKPPHDFANPTSFNYRRYLLSHHIIASGYVVNAKRIKEPPQSSVSGTLANWRHAIGQKLHHYDSGPLLLAMTTGDRGEMSAHHWQVLSKTGTSHLMAISGLHLGICFAWLLALLQGGRKLCLRWQITKNELPVIWPYWVAAALSGGYAIFSGLAMPTLRAWIFVLCFCLLRTLGIQIGPWRLLLAVASLLIVISPEQAYSSSFWLSFTAVACVIAALKVAQGWAWNGWRRLVLIQLGITLGMLPLQAGLFGMQSLLSPAINLIAIPWIGLSILPLSLLAVAIMPFSSRGSDWLFTLADVQLSLLVRGLEYASRLTWQLFYLDLFSAMSCLLWLVLAVGFWLSLHHKTWNKIGLIALPLCALSIGFRQYRPDLTMDLLDVGQGQALIVRKAFETILYDVGPAYPSGFNLADAALNPYLQQEGVRTLDALVISHSDMDHAGGEPFLWPELKVLTRYQPEPKLGYLPCRRAEKLKLTAFEGVFLSPDKLWGNDNDDSCVLYLSTPSTQILLTGDISQEREIQLVETIPSQLKAQILLVPHHGSRSSSSLPFIKQVEPNWALASAGFQNRWHFPSVVVKRRYEKLSIPLLSSSELGQIRMTYQSGQWRWQASCDLRWPVWYRCG